MRAPTERSLLRERDAIRRAELRGGSRLTARRRAYNDGVRRLRLLGGTKEDREIIELIAERFRDMDIQFEDEKEAKLVIDNTLIMEGSSFKATMWKRLALMHILNLRRSPRFVRMFETVHGVCFVPMSQLRVTLARDSAEEDRIHGDESGDGNNYGRRSIVTTPEGHEFAIAATLWMDSGEGRAERTNFADLWEGCKQPKAMVVPITYYDTEMAHAAYLVVYRNKEDGLLHIKRTAMNASEVSSDVGGYGHYAALESFFKEDPDQTLVYDGLAKSAAALEHPGLCTIISILQAMREVLHPEKGPMSGYEMYEIVQKAQRVFADILVTAYDNEIINPNIGSLRDLISKKTPSRKLWLAARDGDYHLVEMLLERHLHIYITQDDIDAAMMIAVREGRVAVVDRLLLEWKANPNLNIDTSSDTPLSVASARGNPEMVEMLLQFGAAVNGRSSTVRRTALWNAAIDGHADVVRVLLQNGADHTIAGTDGSTPLDIARRRRHEDVVALIRRHEGAASKN